MTQTNTVEVSSHYQIALLSTARQQLNIQAADRLLVDTSKISSCDVYSRNWRLSF